MRQQHALFIEDQGIKADAEVSQVARPDWVCWHVCSLLLSRRVCGTRATARVASTIRLRIRTRATARVSSTIRLRIRTRATARVSSTIRLRIRTRATARVTSPRPLNSRPYNDYDAAHFPCLSTCMIGYLPAGCDCILAHLLHHVL